MVCLVAWLISSASAQIVTGPQGEQITVDGNTGQVRTSGGSATQQMLNGGGGTGTPVNYSRTFQGPPPKKKSDNKDQDQTQQLLQALTGMMGGQNMTPSQRLTAKALDDQLRAMGYDVGNQLPSDLPTDGIYGDDAIFGYGGRGAGNVGNGLCTQANASRTQNQGDPSMCRMLDDVLKDMNSCAGRALNNIVTQADSGNFGQLNQFCGNWSALPGRDAKKDLFKQVLAGLITQESGWNPRAAEPTWYKNGQAMGGRGLFQIGVNDAGKDADCAGLTNESIRDPKTNIRCGACIALKYMEQDRTMGHGVNDDGTYGAARYFGPFRNAQSKKRDAIANSTNQWCQASASGQSGGSTSTGGAAGRPGTAR